MSGELDAPNIFSNENVMPQRDLEASLPNPAEMQKPAGRQSAFRTMVRQSQPSSQGPVKMPADFGQMTKSVLMNRPFVTAQPKFIPNQQMPQQMPQQRPNIYNNLGPGNQQMQQRPFTAINPFLMNRGF